VSYEVYLINRPFETVLFICSLEYSYLYRQSEFKMSFARVQYSQLIYMSGFRSELFVYVSQYDFLLVL